MQGLTVLATIVDEIARVNEIVDRLMHGRTENRTLVSHHASRCNKNKLTCRGYALD